jgi:P27 family predicted phage terminase small subunit
LEGNPGKRPLNRAEPQHPPATDSFDAPPAELADHVRAAAEWRRLAPLLRQSRTVTEADRSALIAVCLEWARYLEATAKIKGLVVTTRTGYPIMNPYLPILTRALAACTKLWPELGLTPSSRSRVTAAPAPTEQDPFAEFDRPVRDDDEQIH